MSSLPGINLPEPGNQAPVQLSLAHQLPPEVLVTIFEYVWTSSICTALLSYGPAAHNAQAAVSALCLVCRAWLPPARTVLYEEICLNTDRERQGHGNSFAYSVAFHQSLSQSTHLRLLVKKLRLLGPDWRFCRFVLEPNAEQSVSMSVSNLVRLLPSLRALRIHAVPAEAFQDGAGESCLPMLSLLFLYLSHTTVTLSFASLFSLSLTTLCLDQVKVSTGFALPAMPSLRYIHFLRGVDAKSFSDRVFELCPQLDTIRMTRVGFREAGLLLKLLGCKTRDLSMIAGIGLPFEALKHCELSLERLVITGVVHFGHNPFPAGNQSVSAPSNMPPFYALLEHLRTKGFFPRNKIVLSARDHPCLSNLKTC